MKNNDVTPQYLLAFFLRAKWYTAICVTLLMACAFWINSAQVEKYSGVAIFNEIKPSEIQNTNRLLESVASLDNNCLHEQQEFKISVKQYISEQNLHKIFVRTLREKFNAGLQIENFISGVSKQNSIGPGDSEKLIFENVKLKKGRLTYITAAPKAAEKIVKSTKLQIDEEIRQKYLTEVQRIITRCEVALAKYVSEREQKLSFLQTRFEAGQKELKELAKTIDNLDPGKDVSFRHFLLLSNQLQLQESMDALVWNISRIKDEPAISILAKQIQNIELNNPEFEAAELSTRMVSHTVIKQSYFLFGIALILGLILGQAIEFVHASVAKYVSRKNQVT